MPTEALPDNRVRVTVTIPGESLLVARMQPYRLSDLDRLLAAVRASPAAAITMIGQTVQGRSLEIVRIGVEGPAVKRVFEKSGLKPADMDVIESNEAFAVQAMAVTKDLGLDPAKVNPNGGAVALGHPIVATGCILTVKALYELQRTQKRYALVTMCIGGGQGIAAIFERI